jgi:hypothetical protein
MKKYKVTFSCVGDKTINLVLTGEQHAELTGTGIDGFFELRVGEKRKYLINMRNVVTIYIQELEVDDQ